MKIKALVLLLQLLLVVPASAFAQQKAESKETTAPIIPLKDFFRNPTKVAYSLSPNGEYLAFMQPWESRLNVFVEKIGSGQATRVTSAKARDISGFAWKGDNRIVYIQDTGGDENYRLYAVSIDGSNPKDLTPFEKVRAQIVDRLERNPDEILVGLNKRLPQVNDVYRINVNTGEMNMIAENPGNYTGWGTDWDGKLRIAITTDGVNSTLLFRNTEAEKFAPLVTTSFKETISPVLFTPDNKQLYVASNIGRDKTAIVKYDVETKKEVEKIYEHPEVDVTNVLSSRKRRVITGVSYVTDKTNYHFVDKQRADLQKDLERRLPGYEVRLAGCNLEEDKCLVRTFTDRSLGAYYFYDRTSKNFRKLNDVSPWLNEQHLVPMKPIKYQSRDGLTIHGYLTLPKGVPARNLPVVVNPHGGPWYRDQWGFNPEVQFLANRGYAVLQVNFRGSTGYGRKFWEASFKQWGKTMQDDITDGVQWLIKQGVADPKRIGIYGGSYGGYATLAGLVYTPDLYAAGVDYVGVSNIFTFLKAIPPYWKPYLEMLHEMIGHPEKDKDLLTAASPVFHSDKIKVPLLIVQGANDPRVNKAESDQMVEALKKRGIEVPYIVKANEGHGFANEENRFEFYRAMEEFLGKHLGGRVEKASE
ncbi:MAG TPA: prolyl oligopeptidase family serine peptidase [Pyrinomonadaceae bacterium]|nr:prolyl oligopeptidase family serine peptidase [Pyrinomonadaceae bacterium]